MKNKKIWPAILLIIIIAVAVGVIIYNGTDAARFRKQLDLGHKYLSEMNYEEAVVAFNQAIEIDPRNADAYLGLADAYLGLGDEEAALTALQAGYEATGDGRLKARIDEMKEASAESEAEVSESIEENYGIEERIEEIFELIYYGSGGINRGVSGREHFLTYGQIEAVYRPLAEELEVYLEQEQGNSMAWKELADIYLHLGDMDKSLEVRRKGYEMTGWEEFGAYEDKNGQAFDEYGRIIKNSEGYACTYDSSDRRIAMDGVTNSGDSYHMQLAYDTEGRISKVTLSISGEYGENIFEDSYEYQGNHSVMVTQKSKYSSGDTSESTDTVTYNEYGIVEGTVPAELE